MVGTLSLIHIYFIDTTKVKYYYYNYTCQECQSQYSLEELAI